MPTPTHLLWTDLETTGGGSQDIIEWGSILTTPEIPWPEQGWLHLVIRPHDPQWLDQMDPVVTKMHTSNGLINDVEGHGIGIEDAEEQVIDWLKAFGIHKHDIVIAGVGVSYYDIRRIEEQMPRLYRWFQYPRFDVGSIRAAMKFAGREDLIRVGTTWDGEDKPHRAMDDIRDHLAEWRHYGVGLHEAPADAVPSADLRFSRASGIPER